MIGYLSVLAGCEKFRQDLFQIYHLKKFPASPKSDFSGHATRGSTGSGDPDESLERGSIRSSD
jgi:hypothetical protein